MANKDTNKERLIVEFLMLQNNTTITTREMIDRLSLRYDIDVDRRTIYADMAAIGRVVPVYIVRQGRSSKWTIRRPKEYD